MTLKDGLSVLETAFNLAIKTAILLVFVAVLFAPRDQICKPREGDQRREGVLGRVLAVMEGFDLFGVGYKRELCVVSRDLDKTVAAVSETDAALAQLLQAQARLVSENKQLRVALADVQARPAPALPPSSAGGGTPGGVALGGLVGQGARDDAPQAYVEVPAAVVKPPDAYADLRASNSRLIAGIDETMQQTQRVLAPSATAGREGWLVVAGADRDAASAADEGRRLVGIGLGAPLLLRKDGWIRAAALFPTRAAAEAALPKIREATGRLPYLRDFAQWCPSPLPDAAAAIEGRDGVEALVCQ